MSKIISVRPHEEEGWWWITVEPRRLGSTVVSSCVEYQVGEAIDPDYCACGHSRDMHVMVQLVCKGDNDEGSNVLDENPDGYDEGGWCRCQGFRPLKLA